MLYYNKNQMAYRYEHDIDFDANDESGNDSGYESNEDEYTVEDLNRIRREIELKKDEFDKAYNAWAYYDDEGKSDDEAENEIEALFLIKIRISRQIILKQQHQRQVYSILLEKYWDDEEFYQEQEAENERIEEQDRLRYGRPPPPSDASSDSEESELSDLDD